MDLNRHPTAAGRLAVAALLTVFATGASAHADLDEQIVAVTAQLRTNAASPERLLQRAELYRRHAEYEKAQADLDALASLKPGWPASLLARARTFQEAGQPAEGLRAVALFLQAEADHPDGLIVRARCRVKLLQVSGAVADFSAAIARLPAPMPDLLLERARAQAALGRLDDAVAGLDEGLRKLGEIPSLQLPAIEYERQRADFDGALARVDKLVARYPRKEPWLTLRAEILEQAGRLGEARAVFGQVIAGLESYPPVRRNLDLIKQLEARAREGWARVEQRLKPGLAASVPLRP